MPQGPALSKSSIRQRIPGACRSSPLGWILLHPMTKGNVVKSIQCGKRSHMTEEQTVNGGSSHEKKPTPSSALENEAGFLPVTSDGESWEATEYSTCLKRGEPAGTRTQGPRLKRAMLYRLSYRLTLSLDYPGDGYCGSRSLRPARPFSFSLLNVSRWIRLRRPHLRAATAAFALTCLATPSLNSPDSSGR